MSLTAPNLYRDSAAQFRQQIKPLVLIALISGFVTLLLIKLFLPSLDQFSELLRNTDSSGSLFSAIENMSDDQKQTLFHTSAITTFSVLIGNTLLIGGVLRLLRANDEKKTISALAAIGTSANVWPRLLIQTFIITLIVQLGSLLLIVPGILLAILFSLSPVLLLEKDRGLLRTMKQSVTLVWQHLRVVAPAVICWLVVKMILSMLGGSGSAMVSDVAALLINGIGNLASALLLVYLYRFNSLIR